MAEAGYAARDGAAAEGCAVRGADDLSIQTAAEGDAARGADDLSIRAGAAGNDVARGAEDL